MAFANGYDSTEAGVCMTLSGMAYISSNDGSDIRTALTQILQEPQYATLGQWQVIWFGANHDFGNIVFVVQDTSQPARYAVVNRGTVWEHLEDVVEDMAIFHQKAWTTAVPPTPGLAIARGTYFGLQQIIPLTSSVTNLTLPTGSAPVTLVHLLMSLALTTPPGTDLDVFVTGHSLGGALASVLGAWLVEQTSQWNLPPKKINFKTYTFASPTVGNQAFATYYDGLPANPQVGVQAVRVYNESDVLPHCFSQLNEITNIGIPLTEKAKLEVEALTLPFTEGMKATGVSYVHVDNAYPIPNPTPAPTCANPARGLKDFFCWLGYEHGHNTYLTLVGAPTLPF